MVTETKASTDKGAPASALRSVGQWARIVAIVLSSLGLAFGGWLLATSQVVVGDAHQRNWQDLEVLTDAMESWPRALALMAPAGYDKLNLKRAPHPDIGQFSFEYAPCASLAKDHDRFFLPGVVADEGDRLQVIGALDGQARAGTCFATAIELDRLLPLDRQAPGFAALLIVTPDAKVIEQVGKPRLPVTTLGPLVPVVAFARSTVAVASNSEKAGAVVETTTLGSNPGVVKITIADVDYMAYVRPFTLRGPAAACSNKPDGAKPDSAKPDGAKPSGTSNVQTVAHGPSIDQPCQFYAVGLMPSDRLRHAWLSPPTVLLGGFGLTLLFLVALLPLARLLLIGSAEYASRPQVIALFFGLHAAVAVAMLAVLFTFDLASEREGAHAEAVRSARDLAAGTQIELLKFVRDSIECRNRPKSAPDLHFAEFHFAGNFDSEGKLIPATGASCGATAIPNNTNVSARAYFQDLTRAPLHSITPSRTDYALGAIRGQADGLDQVAIAIAPKPESDPGTFVISTILRSLQRPVLPLPERFMVVDTSQPALPVLFHSVTARAGVEALASQVSRPGEIGAALASLTGGDATFTADYEGRNTMFVARRVGQTHWALLIFYATDDIDVTAGWSAARALSSWASLFVPLMLVGFAFVLVRKGWLRRLWPFEAARHLYREATWNLVVVGMLIGLLAFTRPPFGVLALVVLFVLTVVAGRFAAILRQPPDCDALTVATERHYQHFILATLFCISAAPMAVIWGDAHAFSTERVDAARLAGFKNALAEQDAAQRATAIATNGKFMPQPRSSFHLAPGSWRPPSPSSTFSARIWRQQGGVASDGATHCIDPQHLYFQFCWKPTTDKTVDVDSLGVEPHGLTWPSRLGAATLMLLVALLGGVIWVAVQLGFLSLTGFGTPLGAVSWPKLTIGGESNTAARKLALARTSVLVAPQRVVRDAVEAPADAYVVNLADQLLGKSDQTIAHDVAAGETQLVDENAPPSVAAAPHKKARQVFSGLELILRDPVRRRVALDHLETAVSDLGKTGKPEKLVVIAEMSPLERIIDAYESQDELDEQGSRAREQWRWARLFQSFTTFSFDPIDKVNPKELHERWPDPDHPCRILAEELRWLPGQVIDGAIANSTKMKAEPDLYPHDGDTYREHYSKNIIDWASSIQPATGAAAIDYLRSNLIEHYEQCWLSSSLAERVVLDAIARDGFVNMRKAIALQSLVRRGLVVLDPAPRLMNFSFALFIRQVERPETIQKWRDKQPRSTWSLAQVPLAIVFPAVLVAFVVAAVESGQQLNELVPLLAAGAPTLLGMILRSGRGSTGS